MHTLCDRLIQEEGIRSFHRADREGHYRRLLVTLSKRRRIITRPDIECAEVKPRTGISIVRGIL